MTLPASSGPEVTYLARDYDALRQRLLDRLALILPDWSSRQVPDVTMTLVELLAFLGDRLAYHQDAVATEAYVGTARRRVSVRRHARLVDETLHEGCSARALVLLEAAEPRVTVTALNPSQLTFVTSFEGPPLGPAVLLQPPPFGGEVFCPVDGSVAPVFGALSLASDLAAGATRARVRGAAASGLSHGSILVFLPQAGPLHAVRLLHAQRLVSGETELGWHWDDRLPSAAPQASTTLNAAALCVEHGRPIYDEELAGDRRLRRSEVTFAEEPLSEHALARLLRPDPLRAVPRVRLHEQGTGTVWHWRRDLIDSRADDAHFTLDVDDAGVARVRFGDGSCGRADPGTRFDVEYRVGNGPSGNVGAEALVHAIGAPVRVHQPCSARGGTAPEAMDAVRSRLALGGAKRLRRAVVAQDYASIAETHPRVQRAAAHVSWGGTCELVRVAIDPTSEYELPSDLKRELEVMLDEARRIGHEVRVESARFVPIRIWLEVAIRREHSRTAVGAAIRGKLRELLHPDRLSFGEPIYQSHLIRAVRALGGVESIASIDVTRLTDGMGLDDAGVLRIAPLEIARFQDNEQQARFGYLELRVRGGR